MPIESGLPGLFPGSGLPLDGHSQAGSARVTGNGTLRGEKHPAKLVAFLN